MQYQSDKIHLITIVKSDGTAFARLFPNDMSLHHDLKGNEINAGRDNSSKGRANEKTTQIGRQ